MTDTAIQTTAVRRTETKNLPAGLPFSLEEINKLENIVATYGVAATAGLGEFAKTFALATGMQKLREAVTDQMMQVILSLRGSQLGFRTDRDNDGKPYSTEVVRDCFIEGTLRGARIIGNEINIIAGRLYLTKEYYQRIFGELPGITGVVVVPGLPRIDRESEGFALIRMGLKWRRDGKFEQLTDVEGKAGRVFAVKFHGQLNADQVIGKALRKACKAAFEQVIGSELPDDDEEVIERKSASDPIPSDQKQLPDQKAAQPDFPDAMVGTWDAYVNSLMDIAKSSGVDPEIAEQCVLKLRTSGLKVAASRTSEAMAARRQVITAARNGKLDWKEGKIVE